MQNIFYQLIELDDKLILRILDEEKNIIENYQSLEDNKIISHIKTIKKI